jgi:AbrB family looped-hinge helix DNA binding protein
MQITSKGQVTIPVAIRNSMGLKPHTEVEFKIEDGRVILQTKTSDNPLQHFRGIDKGRYTTEEVMKLTRR